MFSRNAIVWKLRSQTEEARSCGRRCVAMEGRLSESLTGETRVRLYSLVRNKASLLFEGTGRHTGLEIEGEIPTQLRR